MRTEINSKTDLHIPRKQRLLLARPFRLAPHCLKAALDRSKRVAALGVLASALAASGQTIPGLLESNIVWFHKNLSKRVEAGESGVPLLRLDSFSGPIYSCYIEKSGKLVTSGSNGLSNWTDWNRPPLGTTNLQILCQIMDAIPPSTGEAIPLHRQIHISGVHSNRCFYAVFDLEAPPHELRRLFEVIGAPFSTLANPTKKPDRDSNPTAKSSAATYE